jgi:hypothetical protein
MVGIGICVAIDVAPEDAICIEERSNFLTTKFKSSLRIKKACTVGQCERMGLSELKRAGRGLSIFCPQSHDALLVSCNFLSELRCNPIAVLEL